MAILCISDAGQEGLSASFANAGASLGVVSWAAAPDAVKESEHEVILADLSEAPDRAAHVAQWRKGGMLTPIVVLASAGETHIEALQAGADDYLIAPFTPDEVAARVLARAARRASSVECITLADGHLNLESKDVVRDGKPGRLTAMEAKLLTFLAQHPGMSFDKAQLQSQVWGYRKGVRSRTVTTTVQRVRTKIEIDPKDPTHLVTTDDGYALVPAAGDAHGLASPGASTTSAGARRVSVPSVATPFIGRTDEATALVEELLGADTRLLTLLGPGGMGKTRLALEIATTSGARWDDGVVFVELAPLSDATEIPAAALAALALPEGGDVWASLEEALFTFRGLMVFDNLEHLEGASEVMSRILAAGDAATFLATSRTPLKLAAEHVREVRGLDYPKKGSVDDVVASDAGRLFTDSAKRSLAGFSPEAEDRACIAKLVALVDGMPLALVLAASWVRTLRPAEILEEVERSLDLLEGQLSDLPPRHRSVRATLESSWGLMPEPLQRKLAALSVFRLPFARDLARAVADASLIDLVKLADASLLRRNDDGRFEMHPLIHRFATDRLESTTEHAAEVRARYRSHYAHRAGEMGDAAGRMTRDLEEIGAELRPELAEHLAALTLCLEAEEYELCMNWVVPFYMAWESDFVSVARVFGDVVKRLRAAQSDSPARDAALAAYLARYTMAGVATGQLKDPGPGFGEAIALCEGELGETGEVARALVWLCVSIVSVFGGRLDEALAASSCSQASAKAAGNLWFQRIAEGTEMMTYGAMGDREGVLARASHATYAGGGSPLGEGRALMTTSLALRDVAEHQLALEYAEKATVLLRNDSDRGFFFGSLALSAVLRWRLKRPGEFAALREALEEFLAHHIAAHWIQPAIGDVLTMVHECDPTSDAVRRSCARGVVWMERSGAPPQELAGIIDVLGEDVLTRERAELEPDAPLGELVADWLEVVCEQT